MTKKPVVLFLLLLLFFYKADAQILTDFQLHNVYGHEISTDSLKGKCICLDFFGSNCAPCIAEFPALNPLVEKHPQTVFFALTGDSPKKALKFSEKYGLKFTVIPESKSIGRKLSINSTPTHVIIDKKGNVHKVEDPNFKGINPNMSKSEILRIVGEQRSYKLDSLISKYENE